MQVLLERIIRDRVGSDRKIKSNSKTKFKILMYQSFKYNILTASFYNWTKKTLS